MLRLHFASHALALLTCASLACTASVDDDANGNGDQGEGEGEGGEGEGEGEGEQGEGEGEGESAALDPFAPQADTSEGLVNTSADLEAVLEDGALAGACAAWESDPSDRRKKLLCGKAMFFFEGFGTLGVPTALLDFFGNRFPDVTGTAWSGYGLVPDPFTPERPLGVAPGAPLGNVETLAFTCASCHFAQLPDGRYSVGAPNHGYDYGKQILAISLPASSIAPGFDASAHHPDAVAAAQPLIDALAADTGLRLALLFDLLPLIGAAQPAFDTETEGHYAHWVSGTMDFMMAPLPLDDDVHTVSKILSLWALASPEETAAAGMAHEQLAWTGGAQSLMDFLFGFVAIGDGSELAWDEARLSPLHEYLLSLRAPAPLTPPQDAAAVAHGRDVFDAECLACHDGPRGMGRSLYTFEEMGTDDAMRAWADADLDGTFCCGFEGTPSHKVKAPRLVGAWAQGRFLHNGAVSSLEELLCLAPRATDTLPAQGANGHEMGCALDEADRIALVAFLRTL